METITHILTGMVIQIICFIYLIFPFNLILTMILAFLSHYLIDGLAKITYHTPKAHPEDKVWVIWHIITPALIVILMVWLIIINWVLVFFFLIGALFANLVDIIDWVVLRAILKRERNSSYFFHDSVDIIREKVPPFTWMPNWNHIYKGIIPEGVIIISFWVIFFFTLPYIQVPNF